MIWTRECLAGLVRTHIEQDQTLRCALIPGALSAFRAMRAKAADAGFDLQAISSFRDHASQIRIWNAKARGERPLYDGSGNEMNYDALTTTEIVDAILAWSAVPGASRHHLGTDLDVYDAAAVPERADVKLLPEESGSGGVFENLHRWLDEEMTGFGFFRPYLGAQGGMNAEAWHLSYAPESGRALAALTPEMFFDILRFAPTFDHQDFIVGRAAEIHTRFVVNIAATNITK